MIQALLMSKHYTGAADEILKSWLVDKSLSNVKALFCTNASDDLEADGHDLDFVELAKQEVHDAGFDFDNLDLRKYVEKQDDLVELMAQYDVMFFTGGDSSVLLDYFEKTGLKDKYFDLLEKGLVHVGFSAGSVIFSKEMKYYDLFRSDRGKFTEGMQGLGLFQHYLVPHYFDKPKYTKLFEESVKKHPEVTYIPLTNNQGAVLEGEDWEII